MPDTLTSTSILDDLRATAAGVEAVIDGLIDIPDGPEARLFEAMRYGTLNGGKRLRPHLVVCGARLLQVPEARALRVGAAIEMIHSYSLIHDDLPAMDDDDLRRGKPTCHVQFDEATAILAGDALLTLAFDVLADRATHPDAEIRMDLVRAVAGAAGAPGMVGGQMFDLSDEKGDDDPAEIARLERMKTGALISVSCEAGTILAGADGSVREILRTFGYDIGLAFQIADDLLDVEGDENDLGKKVGKDAAAGKATFVALMGPEGARREAQILVDKAIDSLSGFGPEADALRAVARFVLERRN